MLKESKQITEYNFRMYYLRRIKDAFKENKNVTDTAQVQTLTEKAKKNLDVLKRQALISQMYGSGKLVIESQAARNKSQ
ncbi:unnamed protein product [Candidula unifasciata]|uniref:Complex 1 LYR protein domain-containing protein n=1 Tax=Candidula unifasciata TaxID=100452 RepID=A0A8S3Z540_9EUPU|nr:unnamed protein product [Candidula unifasciata]